ncbi:pirin family protein [Tundrisphaera sp. TA3]|uniref:pirin family protein n=1 Tax=Tundrisphaera sp. TA3 TaxID=3435775 RepID=UPI003EB6FE68
MSTTIAIRRAPAGHWVGDGFPVRSLFSHGNPADSRTTSPFLMLDYAGPAEFGPTDKPRGVDSHPHKGFETVTIAYSGDVEHRDSAGGGGRIGPGDVQWMTAGSGLLHEEKHGREITSKGGVFEMVQLWVNLPARDKGASPAYQAIVDGQIPRVALPDGAGTLRVIAGSLGEARGPARTFTPLDLWDAELNPGARVEFRRPAGWTKLVVVLKGQVAVGDGQVAGESDLIVFPRDEEIFTLEAREGSKILVLAGEPIDEPIAAYGPFVMNTQAEIRQAIADFQSGKMGVIEPAGAAR